ncbi:PIN domain-containing protein [Methylobacterium indicum]|uniref:PIN domain-containing protein n=1 Tax=Methylobacterium indicum TaxID=1775910 RepID=UPI0009E64B3E|nr:PIN domain-containing protein [Methylobacterium indicum]
MPVVDTNIVLSAALGCRSVSVFDALADRRLVATSARVAEKVQRVLLSVPDLPAGAPVRAGVILAGIDVIDASYYSDRIESAAGVLSDAVASRNGSTSDAHVLACAWLLDADIWSHDRDFAGTGWPSWSNANLLRALDGA